MMNNGHTADLAERIAKGNALVVVGSGVSLAATGGAKLASWKELINNGLEHCAAHNLLSANSVNSYKALLYGGDIGDLLGVAGQVSDRLGWKRTAPCDGGWSEWLRRTVGTLKATHPEVIEAIQDLGAPIATLNYDSLLTEVTSYRPITWERAERWLPVLQGSDTAILHLHGHWDEPTSVVLGIRSYDAMMSKDLAQLLQRALTSLRSLVFIGCSGTLADPNFKALIGWMREQMRGAEHPHYLLVPRNEPLPLDRSELSGSRVMPMLYGDPADLLAFIRALARDSLGPTHYGEGVRFSPTLPGPKRSGAALGNEVPVCMLEKMPKQVDNKKVGLLGRSAELTRLKQLLQDDKTSVVCIHGPVGSGKTFLTKVFMLDIQGEFGDSINVAWWEFQSKVSETSSDFSSTAFFAEALRAFGQEGDLPTGDNNRCERFGQLLRQRRSLLVLDQVENLQERPPSGEIKDLPLSRLVRDLATRPLNGMLVLCSRYPPSELNEYERNGRYCRIEIPPLEKRDGAELFRKLDLHGGPDEQDRLEELSNNLQGNPLTILLVGGIIANRWDGDVRRARASDQINFICSHPQRDAEKRATAAMELHDRILSKNARSFLRVLGLFGTKMNQEDFDIVLASKAGTRLCKLSYSELRNVYEELSAYNLLFGRNTETHRWDSWDTYALVREYFGRRLRQESPEEWKNAHQMLFRNYKKVYTKEPSLNDLLRMFVAIRHGLLAEQYAEAYRFYREEVAKEIKGYDTEVYGAVSEALGAVYSVFADDGYEEVLGDLADVDKAWLQARASYCHECQGNLRDAVEIRKKSNKLFFKVYIALCTYARKGVENEEDAYRGAGDVAWGFEELAKLETSLGNLHRATATARRAVRAAGVALYREKKFLAACGEATSKPSSDEVPLWVLQLSTLSTLGDAHHKRGRLAEAEKMFAAAADIYSKRQESNGKRKWLMNSESGVRYCALKLDLAVTRRRRQQLLGHARNMIKWAKVDAHVTRHIKGLHYVIEALALSEMGRYDQAEDSLNTAVDLIRVAKKFHFICEPLLARAAVRRLKGHVSGATADVAEALDISRSNYMNLYLAEAYLLSAHLALDNDDVELAKDHFCRAGETVRPESDTNCYFLRIPELFLLEARIEHYTRRADRARRRLDQAERYIEQIGYARLGRQLRNYREGRWGKPSLDAAKSTR